MFDAPIQDEVELAFQSKQLLKKLSNPPTKKELIEISSTYSVDIATRCFYEGIKLSKHKQTIDEINDQSIEPCKIKNNILLYVIPGMFYKEHPELGTNGILIGEIAKKFGIQTKFIQTKSLGSIEENAEILKQQLEQETHPNIWLLSISKGSCDVRSFIQSDQNIDNIGGWIDLCGIHQGVPFIDKAFQSVLSRMYLRVISIIFKIPFTAFIEMKTSDQRWKNNNWPKNIKSFHVVPVPLQSHVHHSLLRRYKQTLVHGPNDGFIPIADSLNMPGCIYPIWSYDHYLRNPNLSQLLYKLFNYLLTTKSHETTILPKRTT